ncbi:MAG: hypothetical protein BGN92_14935 [Sphingobacteriales bacterium 41-5]|nr:MAG: hypothetical protein ABS67_00710 [Niabella sp. SCN 42-15]OJU22542.1 MAG: hypothetical protein BGN92_14935 [Sphingobacteriales bacterium 41-5]
MGLMNTSLKLKNIDQAIQLISRNKKLFIFDLDGTLYNQYKLRRFILSDLLRYYIRRPSKIKELYILYSFRKLREKYHGYCSADLDEEQYKWCAVKTNTKVEIIKKVIEKWIYNEPLKYLPRCIYPGIADLFAALRGKGILIAVYSDYPVAAKLNALRLSTNLVVSSTDACIGCFKPSPKGINYICEVLSVPKEEVVFIGDRYSRDGLCAINASVDYVLIPKNKARAIHKINNLLKQLNNF